MESHILFKTAVDSVMHGVIVQALDRTRWQLGKRPTVKTVRTRLHKYKPKIEAAVADLLRNRVFGTNASVSASEENMAKIGAVMDECIKGEPWMDTWSYLMFFRGCEGLVSGRYGAHNNLVVVSTCELGMCGHNHE